MPLLFSDQARLFVLAVGYARFRALRYGLDGFDDQKKTTLSALLKLPFSVNA